MARIKLEGLSMLKRAPGRGDGVGSPAATAADAADDGASGSASSASAFSFGLVKGAVMKGGKAVVGGVGGVGKAVAGGVGDVANGGVAGVFSLGLGFRNFLLKGSVVELAVAVVLGTAFTDLISAATSDFLTPLIAAIFAGSEFSEASFTINNSRFNYGHFTNALFVFVLVAALLYFGVVLPLTKLQYAAFKHKAIMRDCPQCLEEISAAATRCKFCCGEVPMDEETARMMEIAEAAIEEREQKRGLCSKLVGRCFRPRRAVISRTETGEVTVAELHGDEEQPGPALRARLSGAGARVSLSGGGGGPAAAGGVRAAVVPRSFTASTGLGDSFSSARSGNGGGGEGAAAVAASVIDVGRLEGAARGGGV